MTAKKFSSLRDDLYERSPDSRGRVEHEVSQLRDQLALGELRARRSQTQAQLARALGTTQSAISRLERQGDLLVSTLRDYVVGTGGHLRLVAEYDDYEFDVDVPVLHEPADGRSSLLFRVVWQNLETRRLVHVGWLRIGEERCGFEYTPEAHLDPDFEPFPAFPDLAQKYSSPELFPFFADRVALPARGATTDLTSALGLARAEASPVELLSRTWGRTPHDTIQIVPEPRDQEDGTSIRFFLVSGVRYVDEEDPERVSALVAGLKPGQELSWSAERDNPVNDRAIRIEVDGQQVGWMPDYLLDDVNKTSPTHVSIFVEQANGPDTPWHLRLLCRMESRTISGS